MGNRPSTPTQKREERPKCQKKACAIQECLARTGQNEEKVGCRIGAGPGPF